MLIGRKLYKIEESAFHRFRVETELSRAAALKEYADLDNLSCRRQYDVEQKAVLSVNEQGWPP